MIQLRDASTGAVLGNITETQLDFLMSQLEEESTTDEDYYIDGGTISMLEDEGADAELIGILRAAIQGKEGIDIAWSD